MSELDRYLDDFGARLSGARPPRRRRFVLAGALIVATAVVAAALLLAPGGSGGGPAAPVDAVAAVRRALDPDGVILHFRIRSEVDHRASYQETWSAQDPKRWRLRWWSEGGPKLNRGPDEFSYGNRETRSYTGRRLIITTGYGENTPQARLPTFFSQTGRDPDADLRDLLTSGELVDEGEHVEGGKTVRRLRRDDGLRELVVDVDPATFVPVAGTITLRPPGKSRAPVASSSFTVEVFERIPLSAESEKLLAIHVPRGTKTVKRTAAGIRRYMREHRAWRKSCRFGKNHMMICPKPEPRLPGS